MYFSGILIRDTFHTLLFFSIYLSIAPSFSHTLSLLHSIFSPSFNIFPLRSLFISLSITTPVHSSLLSSFNYSVHQFLPFFQLFCQPSLTLQSSILPHTPSLPHSITLLSICSLFTLSLSYYP